MTGDNPERVTNRGLLGTEADPSGQAVKTDVQEDPLGPGPKQVIGIPGPDPDAADEDALVGLKGGSVPPPIAPTPNPFRDAVEYQARAEDLEATGTPIIPPDEAYRATEGDNLETE